MTVCLTARYTHNDVPPETHGWQHPISLLHFKMQSNVPVFYLLMLSFAKIIQRWRQAQLG